MTARGGEAGLTLIEMMIVLAIIAIAAGSVVLGIGMATRGASAESEARRLATRLQAAADDAMLGDRLLVFTADKKGYGFASWDGKGWAPRTDEALGYHRLPTGMTLILDAPPPIELGLEGAGRPLNAVVELGDGRWTVRWDGLTAQATPGPA